MTCSTRGHGLLRVVLVDDNAALLAAVTQLLDDYGIRVVATATDGCQTLSALVRAAAAHGGVDVLILDASMPHTNGIEAAGLVRRFYPTLPVILYTAYAGMLGDAPREAGVTLEVDKAAGPLALVGALHQACGSRPSISPGNDPTLGSVRPASLQHTG